MKNKNANITLSKKNSERLSFVRKLKRTPQLNKLIEAAIEDICATLEKRLNITDETWVEAKTCPSCSSGVLYLKKSKRNKLFFGCSNFPKCDHSEFYSKTKPIY